MILDNKVVVFLPEGVHQHHRFTRLGIDSIGHHHFVRWYQEHQFRDGNYRDEVVVIPGIAEI